MAALVQICLCDVNVAIDLPGLPQIPAPATDQSCAATTSANTLIGVGCPHAAPSCANLHSVRRSRRHRLQFPAGSFIEGFRTPATVQAASLRSAGIRNPQQIRKCCPLMEQPLIGQTNQRLTGLLHQILIRKPVIIEVVSTLVAVPAKPNLAPGVPGNAEAKPFVTLP